MTEQQREAGADVPEDVPQSENVDERAVKCAPGVTPEVQEGRDRMRARSNPKSQLSSSGMQKRKVQNMTVRTSSK